MTLETEGHRQGREGKDWSTGHVLNSGQMVAEPRALTLM
jgi:hypothetical protein